MLVIAVVVISILATLLTPAANAQQAPTHSSQGSSTTTLEMLAVADDDVAVVTGGFGSNPEVTLADPGDANGSLRQITVWLRMQAGSCASDVQLRVTDPKGDSIELEPFVGCPVEPGLLEAIVELPETGQGDWLVAFDHEVDRGERSGGYSVRAVRLDAVIEDDLSTAQDAGEFEAIVTGEQASTTALSATGDEGAAVEDAEPVGPGPEPVVELIDVFDNDFDVYASDWSSNDSVVLSDNAGPGARRLTIWIRTSGTSCERDIRIRATAPHGGQLDLEPFSNCDQIADLVQVTVEASYYGTGEWKLQFDDAIDDNGAGSEYSVRGARLDSVSGSLPTDDFGRAPLLCQTVPVQPSDAGGGVLDEIAPLRNEEKANPSTLPPTALFAEGQSYWFEYIAVTDQVMRVPGSEVDFDHVFTDAGAGDDPQTADVVTQGAEVVNRSHSRVRADVVMTPVGATSTGSGQWVNVQVLAACAQSWTEELASSADLKSIADEAAPAGSPDQAEDVSVDYQGSFQFERFADGSIGEIVHEGDTDPSQLMFREGMVNALPIDMVSAAAETATGEVDRTTEQVSDYAVGADNGAVLVSKTAQVDDLGLTRRADTTLDADGGLERVRAREEMSLQATRGVAAGPVDGEPADHGDDNIPWADTSFADPATDSLGSPVDAFILQTVNLGRLGSTSPTPGVVEAAAALRADSSAIRNTLDPATAQAQVAQIEVQKAEARYLEALELIDESQQGGQEAADQALPRVVRLLTSAFNSDSALAADAAQRIFASGDASYQSQVLVASFASSQSGDAHVLLGSIIASNGVSEEVQLGAMVNALSIADPPVEVIDALLARAGDGSSLSNSALMIAGGAAANSSDAAAVARVESALQARIGDRQQGEAAMAGLTNLTGVVFEQREESRADQDNNPDDQEKSCDSEDCWRYINCGIQTGDFISDAQCDGLVSEHCNSLIDADPRPDVDDWPSCRSIWEQPDAGDNNGYSPPKPGDMMGHLVLGPRWAQGHFWLGIDPKLDARAASVSAEAGLEFKVAGEVYPLLEAGAKFQVQQKDENPDDNWDVGDMTIGQVERELVLTASFRGDQFVDTPVSFPCGIGASGGFDESAETGTSTTEGTDIDLGTIDIPDVQVPKAAAKLFPEIIAAGPGADASVPVLGVVSLAVGINAGVRIKGDWSWSVDMCNLGIGGALGTAAGQVSVTGAATIDAYAGIEFLLLEAGIGANVTIFKVETPFKASLQLLNDQGRVKLQPCYSFTLNPTLFAARVYAYARVFIKIPFIGKKIILWKWSGDLLNFNLGSELGLEPITILQSECSAVDPLPPQIVTNAGAMSVSNGVISNPEITQEDKRRPIGVTSSDGQQELLNAAIQACSFYGLGEPLTTPLKRAFEQGGELQDFFRWTGPVDQQSNEEGKVDGDDGSLYKSGDGGWELTSIDAQSEQLSTVVCDVSAAEANDDIAITAWVDANGSNTGVNADAPGALSLNHNETYPVEFEITNTTGQTLIVDSVTLDGALVLCNDAPSIADGETGSCVTNFVASANYGVSNAASIYDDLAADLMHTVRFEFVPEDGSDPLAPVEHLWFHGLDPETINVASHVRIQLAVDVDGVDAFREGNISPGPLLARQSVPVWIEIKSTGNLENVSIGSPFDVECEPQTESLTISCNGYVELPDSDGGQTAPITAETGQWVDGEKVVVDLGTDWYFRYLDEPELSIDTYINGDIAVASPGPNLQNQNDPYHDLRFRVSNKNATPLETVQVVFDIAGHPDLPGANLNADTCYPVGTSKRTWECTKYSLFIDPTVNSVLDGVVAGEVTWGNPTPFAPVEGFANFFADNRIAGANAVTDLITYPAAGIPTIDVGADGAAGSGTGTGTFVAEGQLLGGATDVNVTVESGAVIDPEVDLAAGTWRAEVLAYPAGQPGTHFDFDSKLTATVTMQSGEVATQTVDFKVRPPSEHDTIRYSNVIDLDARPSTYVSSLTATEVVVNGLTVGEVQQGDIVISRLDGSDADPGALLDDQQAIAAEVQTVAPVAGGVRLGYVDTTLDKIYRQVDGSWNGSDVMDWVVGEVSEAPFAYLPANDLFVHKSGGYQPQFELLDFGFDHGADVWGLSILTPMSLRMKGRVTLEADAYTAEINGAWTLPPFTMALWSGKIPRTPLTGTIGASSLFGFDVQAPAQMRVDGTFSAEFEARLSLTSATLPVPVVVPIVDSWTPSPENDLIVDMTALDGGGPVEYEVRVGANVAGEVNIFRASNGSLAPSLPASIDVFETRREAGLFLKGSAYAKFESIEEDEATSGGTWVPGSVQITANLDVKAGLDAGTKFVRYWTDWIEISANLVSIPVGTYVGSGDPVQVGDVIVSEIKHTMANPNYFEYFEVTNGLGTAIDLDGWSLDEIDRDGFGFTHAIDGFERQPIAAGGTGIVCVSTTPITGNAQCSGVLAIPEERLPTDGFLLLRNNQNDFVDIVAVRDFASSAASQYSSTLAVDADLNDLVDSWCASTAGYITGEPGSPASANEPCPAASTPSAVITEVKGGLVDNDQHEWIEVLNTSSQALDLDLWQIRSADDVARTRRARDAALIAPGERGVICNKRDADNSLFATSGDTGFCSAFWGSLATDPNASVWGNVDLETGQDIELWAGNLMVDEAPVLYTEPHRRSFAVAGDNENTSANDDPANWCEQFVDAYVGSLTDGEIGTPGEENAECADSSEQLVISEYQRGANDQSRSYEWIEVYNPGSSDVSLDNWVVSDGTSDVALSLPNGDAGLVGPGEYAVICADRSIDGSWTGVGDLCDATWDAGLVSLDGLNELWLTSPSFTDAIDLQLVAVPDAAASNDVTTAVMVSGPVPDATSNDDAAAWCTSLAPYAVDGASRVEYGTPGEPNGDCHGMADQLVSLVEVKRSYDTMFHSAWIEIRNGSTIAVNPNRWLIADGSGQTAEVSFDAQSVIEPGDIALLCVDANDFADDGCDGTLSRLDGGAFASFDPVLPGELQLTSEFGRVGSSIAVPIDIADLPETDERFSLMVIPGANGPLDNDEPTNWCPSAAVYTGTDVHAEHGTPGAQNTQCVQHEWMVTEIKPWSTTDGLVRWFEVYNFGASTLAVDGFTIQLGTQQVTVDGAGRSAIPAGEYGLLCLADGHSANDLASCSGVFSGLSFYPYQPIRLDGHGGSFDEVASLFDVHGSTTDPSSGAASLILRADVGLTDTSANDDWSAWCSSQNPYVTVAGRADYASPLGANGPCGPSHEPEWLISEVQTREFASEWAFQWIELALPDAISGGSISGDWTIVIDGTTAPIQNAETLAVGEHLVFCRETTLAGSPASLPYDCGGTWSGPVINAGSTIEVVAPDGISDTTTAWDIPGAETGASVGLAERWYNLGRSINDDQSAWCTATTIFSPPNSNGSPGERNLC